MRAHAVATIQIKRNALLSVDERQSENAKAAAQEEDEQAYPGYDCRTASATVMVVFGEQRIELMCIQYIYLSLPTGPLS
jgi:hypothetical protein